MFADNELRSKRLRCWQPGSPFRSPCVEPLCAAGTSETSNWVGRLVNPAAPPPRYLPCTSPVYVPGLCWSRAGSPAGLIAPHLCGKAVPVYGLGPGACLVADQRWGRNWGDQPLQPQAKDHVLFPIFFLKMQPTCVQDCFLDGRVVLGLPMASSLPPPSLSTPL